MTTNKEIVKLILFVLTYQRINYVTRYVLMALMEYQTMFNQEDTFRIYTSYMYDKFNVTADKLLAVLEYLQKYNWVTYVDKDKYYEVTINYEVIDKKRIYEIEQSKKK